DRQRDVREPGLVHDALGPARVAGPVEVQQLEHEAVAPEVDSGHPERRVEAQEPARRVVGWLELALEREPEQLLVEAARAIQVGDALTDVVERARAGHDQRPTAATRLAAVSFGETRYHACSTRPFSSTRNAERMIPMYFLPYMLFSPHTPYASATAWSSSARSGKPKPYLR